jgi:DNA-binding CsgD family transcriptional regulator
MVITDALVRGRESFEQNAWGDAYTGLSTADHEEPLELSDLERLATAAYLAGRDDDSLDALIRAHQVCLRLGLAVRAARCAFWLGFILMNKGEFARGGGWLGRAQRLLEDQQQECVEHGYLLIPAAIQSISQGDAATAYDTCTQAASIADRFGDPDLLTMAQFGQGLSLIRLEETAKGVALFDEIMVTVTTGEVWPIVAGIAYCGVIEACQEIFDLRRAREWTSALTDWCASQPDLVPYRGECMVYRAEVMRLRGDWLDALDEARRALEILFRSATQQAVGAAYYQQAELHRLRGEFALAEEAYRQASQWGHEPQPGLALLRLTQDQADTAAASIRRALDETRNPPTRARLLAASIEIMLAIDDVQAARAAADELSRVAAELTASALEAISRYATGAVLLAEEDARAALAALRRAWTVWQELEAPYEAARARLLIGVACRELGDEDSAELEIEAARRAFQHLGAVPDLARLERLTRKAISGAPTPLTAREVQVLRLIAAGKTNRAIAGELFISEKTVARHVSNIFNKLDLSSRAAATAYAYEHDLVTPST